MISKNIQVQNQDPISPSGRGRHNTGVKDGKVLTHSGLLVKRLSWHFTFLKKGNMYNIIVS